MKSDMESNYKRLGDYIRQIDNRNSELAVSNLLGVSINKKFIDSHANTNGTDFRKYKIVKMGQFTYIPVTSRNGDRVSIARLTEENECLVSETYITFEVIDCSQLNPEYLMLLFKTPEFDKFARYNSWGSAREVFSWDDFCELKISVPAIIEQHNIVEHHKRIQTRINTISNIESKLLEILKSYLTDKLEHVSDYVLIQDYCDKIQSGATPSRTNTAYWENPTIPWVKNGEVKNNIILNTEESISEEGLNNSSAKIIRKGSVLLAMYCVSTPQLAILNIDAATNQAVCCMTLSSEFKSLYLYYYLMFFGQGLTDIANGSAQQNLNSDQIKNYEINVPNNCDENTIIQLHRFRTLIAQERDCLTRLQKLLVSQMF